MKKWIRNSILLAVTWIFVKGMSPDRWAPGIVEGLMVGIPLSYAFRRFYPGETEGRVIERTTASIKYIYSFSYELLMSNMDTAYRVLSPSMPINPEVIELDLDIEDPMGVMILANSITLTPGTLVLDHDAEKNSLEIHCLNYTSREDVEGGIRKWEKLLIKIFEGEKQ